MILTMQEFFEKTINHLVAQGQQATNQIGACLYRAPEGRKCAAGVHMGKP